MMSIFMMRVTFVVRIRVVLSYIANDDLCTKMGRKKKTCFGLFE